MSTPTYKSWRSMLTRCTNPRASNFKYYGGRGISICARWKVFENFLKDMGKRPEGKTLDRFPNVNGNYEPGNCRWATNSQQSISRTSSLSGINIRELRTKRGWTIYQLASRMNVQASTISRWERGLSHPYSKEIPKLEKIFKIKIRRIGVNGRER